MENYLLICKEIIKDCKLYDEGENITTFKDIIFNLNLQNKFNNSQLKQFSNTYLEYTQDQENDYTIDGYCLTDEQGSKIILFNSYTTENLNKVITHLILSELYLIGLENNED